MALKQYDMWVMNYLLNVFATLTKVHEPNTGNSSAAIWL